MPTQVDNGKAFEYSVAKAYFEHLSTRGQNVNILQDRACAVGKSKYDLFAPTEKQKFDLASIQTINTISILEPGLLTQRSVNDVLEISLVPDSAGQAGDVRDVIFRRRHVKPFWEVGLSVKNNHDAVKHSRLSPTIDFGREWLGLNCTRQYFDETKVIFDQIGALRQADPTATWASLGTYKATGIYKPILQAFRAEMIRLSSQNSTVPSGLLAYLIGRHPFYKVIKDDANHCVAVKAFNLNGLLNKSFNGVRPSHSVDRINFPTRIIEFDFVSGSDTTLMMILDHGWQISFRIHSATTLLEKSLKFDINLIGNPPILFTQHLFI